MNVCVCVSHIFFICSPADGHLACIHILAVVSSAAVNIRVHGDLDFFLDTLRGFWDLCSSARDQTCAPCNGSMGVLTPGPPGNSIRILDWPKSSFRFL